jgi:hypothetical protein
MMFQAQAGTTPAQSSPHHGNLPFHLLQLYGQHHPPHLTLFQTERESHTITLELLEMDIAPGPMIHTLLQVEENTLLSLNLPHLAMFPTVNQALHILLHQVDTLPMELRL